MENENFGLSGVSLMPAALASIEALTPRETLVFEPTKRAGDKEAMRACLRRDNGFWEIWAHPADKTGVALLKGGERFMSNFSKKNQLDILAALDALGLAEGTELAYHGNEPKVAVTSEGARVVS